MREISVEDLQLLNDKHGSPMISIYLTKEQGLFEQKTVDERWRNSLAKAEFFLLKDYSRSFTELFLKPLQDLKLDELVERTDKGVVIFMAADHEVLFMRAHSSLHDLTVVADSFHIKPLIKIKNLEKGFFLVSMTSRAINVFIDNDGHLLRLDSYRNDTIQEGARKRTSEEFFRHAADELNKLFISYTVPVILAGVKDHLGHMKRLLPQSMLMKESIVGNVEKMKASELREKVVEILKPFYQKQEIQSQSELDAARSKDRVLFYLEDIAISAVYGKIKKLFVVENKYVWGSINRHTGALLISPKQTNAHDDDILDDLCQLVLSKGGEVEVVNELTHFEGHLAAAIVTDRSHLTYSHTE